MRDVFKVVDKFGETVRGTGRRAKRLYFRREDAQGVATQFNNIEVIRNGEVTQVEGAPFRAEYAGSVDW